MKTEWNGTQRVAVEHVLARWTGRAYRCACVSGEADRSGVTQTDVTSGSTIHMMPHSVKNPTFAFSGSSASCRCVPTTKVFSEMFAAMGPKQREAEVLVQLCFPATRREFRSRRRYYQGGEWVRSQKSFGGGSEQIDSVPSTVKKCLRKTGTYALRTQRLSVRVVCQGRRKA